APQNPPNRNPHKPHRQSQPQCRPRQIRKIDGERGPCDDDNLDQKLDSRDQPAEQCRHQAAISNEWILLNLNSTAASSNGPIVVRLASGPGSRLKARARLNEACEKYSRCICAPARV